MSSSPAVAEPPITYPPNAVLTTAQVATWLNVHPRQLSRLRVPRLKLGHKTVRYLAKSVQAWIERQAKKSH
jgi:hypothetical protein